MNVSLPNWIRFGRDICGDLEQAERREWWLANGLGGYAAGTIAGTLTRRYHGLLIAPVNPPLGRVLVFAKADATLIDADHAWPLASNRWRGGAIDPCGHVHIESFHLDGRLPVWRYAVGDIALEQRIWMEPGANTTYVAWRLVSDTQRPLQLHVKLLVNARDHHGNASPGSFNPLIEGDGQYLQIKHPDWFTLHLRARGGELFGDHVWYENFDLPMERERGLPDVDNHLYVGEARLILRGGEWTGIVASLHDDASPDLDAALRRAWTHDSGQLERAQTHVGESLRAPDWVDQLLLAADSFVIARPLPELPQGESVIAGYPWFGDWGRDTMIALPGLTLATGRLDSARRILDTFARFIDQGMLPNVFPGAGETPEYNSVDAALWYVEAWRAYVDASGDGAGLRTVFPVLESLIDWHVKGTRYGIGMDADDGLLRAGVPGVQLTWMDAKVGDWVVTPRSGKPVEINALWYNALVVMADFARQLGSATQPYLALAERARAGFQRFVRVDGQGLFDVLDTAQGSDATLRPNQIFAVSLYHSPLDPVQQRQVVDVCAR